MTSFTISYHWLINTCVRVGPGPSWHNRCGLRSFRELTKVGATEKPSEVGAQIRFKQNRS